MTDMIPLHSLSKEEARKQFEHYTKVLGLKHVFSFDEVWDTLAKERAKKQFRDSITTFEKEFAKVPGVLGKDPFPLVHTFAGGLYIRHLTVPPDTLTVTRIHKSEHAFFLQKGTISILTEEGVKRFTAPYNGITKIGTKRIIYHHDEVIFITVHATKETTVEKAEEELFTDDFDDVTALENKAKQFIIDVKQEDLCRQLD